MRKDIQRMQKVMAQIKNPSFPPPTAPEVKASTTSVDLNIPDPSKQIVEPKLQPVKDTRNIFEKGFDYITGHRSGPRMSIDGKTVEYTDKQGNPYDKYKQRLN